MSRFCILTEISCCYNDDSMIVANETGDNEIALRFYKNANSYKQGNAEKELSLPRKFINEITRVFPCPEL